MPKNQGEVQVFLTEPLGSIQQNSIVLPIGVLMNNGQHKIFAQRLPDGELHVITFVYTIQLSSN